VSAIAPETILAVFAIFCRVGACLMVAPGFSSSQVPTRARLFIALAVSLALSALLMDTVRPAVGDGSPVRLVALIFTELAVGIFLGFVIRLLFAALQFIAVVITQSIGLSALPGTVTEETDQVPPLATLYTVTATTLMFVAGLHGELLRGLVESYAAIPPGQPFRAQPVLIEVADRAGTIFLAALRIGSPFIVFSVLVNFAIGVTNKLTPQIPVFFIATPFMIMGGLLLILFTVHDFFAYFTIALSSVLEGG
jgi:flagellar biosynthetic protein FliR